MKLIRAQFENFRLLRNLELIFSTDNERNLTVIRAANETGKTTILTALQWCLYGDSSLPGKGSSYRLHPIDWDIKNGTRVCISVTVDFEVTNIRRRDNRNIETKTEYRLVRTAYEKINGNDWNRTPPSVLLYRITDQGAEAIDNPDSLINDELPPELREVFFTDGDRALSFIEADVSLTTKRDKVQKAIRSLLGLNVINEAIRHVKKSSQEVNKKARNLGDSEDLSSVAERLNEIEDEIESLNNDYEDAKEQFLNIEDKISDIDRKIDAALRKGDKDKLAKDFNDITRQIKNVDGRLNAAVKEHSNIFKSKKLAMDLFQDKFDIAFRKLKKMEKRGDIPNTTIPILKERLEKKICICGESLDPNISEAKARVEYINNLIDDSQKADEIKKITTEIYYTAQNLQKRSDDKGSLWLEEYSKIVESRDNLDILRDDLGRKKKAIELQIGELPDTDIQGLRETKRKYIEQKEGFLRKQGITETKISNLNIEHENLKSRRDSLLKQQEKGAMVLSESLVISDILNVLQDSYRQITNEELFEVSTQMNATFLEMIGSDPDQGSIINRAEISKEFDILVYGPQDKTLDPDRDLNGASRRALTLSFILALTIVSEVEAPNVIDTPLGMMSGYVKRSVLRSAISKSSQLILFLTHDEINGCADVIDEAAGMVVTLTNPAHYPKMLVNDPKVEERTVLLCDCTHNEECELCKRVLERETELEYEGE